MRRIRLWLHRRLHRSRVWRGFIGYLLDQLDVDHILNATHKRGWVAVPKSYAVRAWPENVRTGWWPVLEEDEHA